MRKLSLLVLLYLLWLPRLTQAQTITIQNTSNRTVCAGSVVSISFTTAGTFAADNVFRVELVGAYGTPPISLPQSVTASPLTITIPTALKGGSYYSYRILSTNPAVVSDPFANEGFTVQQRPTATLLNTRTDTLPVNPYSQFGLKTTTTGGGSYTLTFQDSTRFIKKYETEEYAITPAQTTTYRLASVRNACGLGTVSGSTTIRVNSVGIQSLPPYAGTCLGKTLPFYFATSSPLPANTRFEAELTDLDGTSPAIALPVSGSVSPLQIQLPASVPPSASGLYKLRVYAREADLSVWFQRGGSFALRSTPPRLSVLGWEGTYGEKMTLTIGYSNANGTLRLSTGEQIRLYGSGTRNVAIDPTGPTTYSIAGYTDACFDSVTYDRRLMQVTPDPGLRIDSLSRYDVCMGQPVSVYYTASSGYTLPGRLQVRSNAFAADLEATVVRPGELRFTPVSGLLRSAIIQLINKDTGQPIAAYDQPLLLKTPPLIELYSLADVLLTEPGEVRLQSRNFDSGGAPVRVALSTGSDYRLDRMPTISLPFIPVYVTQSTAYSVVSIANECGLGQARGSLSVQVKNPAPDKSSVRLTGAWLTEPDSKSFTGQPYFCPGGTQQVLLTMTGTFAADNQFRLEIADSTGTYPATPVRTTTQPGSLTFTWPNRAGTVRMRVSTTNPATLSNELVIKNAYFYPQAELTLQTPTGTTYPDAYTLLTGQSVLADFRVFGSVSPVQYEWLDGTKGSVINTLYYVEPDKIVRPTTSGLYGIRRLVDGCGISATRLPQKSITVVPSLLVSDYTGGVVCVGRPVTIPIRQLGDAPLSTSYVVQVSTDQLNWQTLPTTGTARSVQVVVPSSLANQIVSYRVAGVVNGLLQPGAVSSLTVSSPPSVILSGPNQATLVGAGAAESTKLEWQNPAPGFETLLLYNSSTGLVTPINPFYENKAYYAYESATYSLLGAYNQCGYGSAQGTVRVVRRPTLTQFATSRATYCAGETVSLTYAAQDLTPDNRLALYLADAKATRTLLTQTSVAAGTYAFPVSQTMAPGSYSMVYESSLLNEPLKQVATFTVQRPLSLTLATERRIVYAGTVVSLPLTATANSGPYSLTVSTPGGLSVITDAQPSVLTIPRPETGTYRLLSAANQCGAGYVTGAASLTVLPRAAVSIQPETAAIDLLCTGKTYTIPLSTTGTFGSGNTFTAYLTDSVGGSRRALPTVARGNALTVTVPTDAPTGNTYLLRVGSSDPEHLGASLPRPLNVRPTPTATLTGTTSIFKGDSVRLGVALTGASPWQLILTDGAGARSFIAQQTPYTIAVRPDSTRSYRLTEVRNAECGAGTASGTALITVSPLLANEPLPVAVRVWPNPTAGLVQVEGQWSGNGTVQIRLHSLLGTLVLTQVVLPVNGKARQQLDMSQLPTGVYLLTVEREGQRSQFKVVKQ